MQLLQGWVLGWFPRPRVAFRGGTALHKLFLHPAVRYSEDIDLVQVDQEPIGQTLDLVRGALEEAEVITNDLSGH